VLTEVVQLHPYTVVLLDEVGKAHPDVMELFYQAFDKGTLEDAEGVVVEFRNTVILLTSNVGAETTDDSALVAAITACCTEVESGAREVDHCLTRSLLPELSGRLLMRMALGSSFSRAHVSLDEAGGFVYTFLPPTSSAATRQQPSVPSDRGAFAQSPAGAILSPTYSPWVDTLGEVDCPSPLKGEGPGGGKISTLSPHPNLPPWWGKG
jgi:MoxR-like ATPase